MQHNYTNYSGGATGADSAWDIIGRDMGFINHIHYYHGKRTPLGNKLLSDTDIAEGINHAKKAAKVLGRNWSDKYSSLLGRNWFQVKNSTRILAISRLVIPGNTNSRGFKSKSNKVTVDGGTGYAVEMAIANNKEVFVFDCISELWYNWIYNRYIECEIPILSLNYAGIGTRDLTDAGIIAIVDVYKKTIKEYEKHNYI